MSTIARKTLNELHEAIEEQFPDLDAAILATVSAVSYSLGVYDGDNDQPMNDVVDAGVGWLATNWRGAGTDLKKLRLHYD